MNFPHNYWPMVNLKSKFQYYDLLGGFILADKNGNGTNNDKKHSGHFENNGNTNDRNYSKCFSENNSNGVDKKPTFQSHNSSYTVDKSLGEQVDNHGNNNHGNNNKKSPRLSENNSNSNDRKNNYSRQTDNNIEKNDTEIICDSDISNKKMKYDGSSVDDLDSVISSRHDGMLAPENTNMDDPNYWGEGNGKSNIVDNRRVGDLNTRSNDSHLNRNGTQDQVLHGGVRRNSFDKKLGDIGSRNNEKIDNEIGNGSSNRNSDKIIEKKSFKRSRDESEGSGPLSEGVAKEKGSESGGLKGSEGGLKGSDPSRDRGSNSSSRSEPSSKISDSEFSREKAISAQNLGDQVILNSPGIQNVSNFSGEYTKPHILPLRSTDLSSPLRKTFNVDNLDMHENYSDNYKNHTKDSFKNMANSKDIKCLTSNTGAYSPSRAMKNGHDMSKTTIIKHSGNLSNTGQNNDGSMHIDDSDDLNHAGSTERSAVGTDPLIDRAVGTMSSNIPRLLSDNNRQQQNHVDQHNRPTGGARIVNRAINSIRFERVGVKEWEMKESRIFNIDSLLTSHNHVISLVDESKFTREEMKDMTFISQSKGFINLQSEFQGRKSLIASWPKQEHANLVGIFVCIQIYVNL